MLHNFSATPLMWKRAIKCCMPTGEVGHGSQLLLSVGIDDSFWTIKDANRMNCRFKLSLQYNVCLSWDNLK